MAAVGKWVAKNIFGFKAPTVEKPKAQRMGNTMTAQERAEEERRKNAQKIAMGGMIGTDLTGRPGLGGGSGNLFS